MAEKLKTVSTTSVIGTLCITLIIFNGSCTTPALSYLYEQFAEYPQWIVSLIATLPAVGIILGTFLFGLVANGKMKFKTIAQIGMLSCAFFGILPTFLGESLPIVLICRFFCGFGTGFIMSLGATWFMRSVRNETERGRYLGWNQAFGSFGSIVMTMLGGTLAAINWKYTFLAYLFVFIGWIGMTVFFKEPKSVDEIIREEGIEAGAEFEKAKHVKLPAAVWIILLLYGIHQMLVQVGFNLGGMFMGMGGMSPAFISAVFSFFSLVTIALCIPFGRIFAALGKFTTPLILLVGGGLGMLLLATAGDNMIMYIAAFVCFGIVFCVNVCMNIEVSMLTNPAGFAWCATLIIIAQNLFQFLSSPCMGILQAWGGSNLQFPVFFCAGAYVVLSALFLILHMVKKEMWENPNSENEEVNSKAA